MSVTTRHVTWTIDYVTSGDLYARAVGGRDADSGDRAMRHTALILACVAFALAACGLGVLCALLTGY